MLNSKIVNGFCLYFVPVNRYWLILADFLCHAVLCRSDILFFWLVCVLVAFVPKITWYGAFLARFFQYLFFPWKQVLVAWNWGCQVSDDNCSCEHPLHLKVQDQNTTADSFFAAPQFSFSHFSNPSISYTHFLATFWDLLSWTCLHQGVCKCELSSGDQVSSLQSFQCVFCTSQQGIYSSLAK